MSRDLSSYAFNKYGEDAKLYNGIHDLETALIDATTPKATKETLRVPIVSTGQLVIMTCATFDALIRHLEGADVEVSIEHPEKEQQAEFTAALQLASKADPDGKVHDLLKATLEGEG